MKFSYNLLKELVSLHNLSASSLATIISDRSFEVEAVTPVKHFGVGDFELEIETGKTNRIDAMGHWGMAREIGAITGHKLIRAMDLKPPEDAARKSLRQKRLKLSIHPILCRKYAAWRFVNVKPAPSPDWLKSRLLTCGVKALNNVVDAANYAMLISSQPLHAFDAQKIAGNTISVRPARPGETLLTLDQQKLALNREDLVIADAKGPIALAGIKGGLRSGVTDKTTEIIVEAANFDPVRVRRTSRRHGLRTDAAHRFEKDLPVEFVEAGLNEMMRLLVDLGHALPAEAVMKANVKPKTRRINLNVSRVEELLGYQTSAVSVKRQFDRLGFVYRGKGKLYRVSIPFYRPDIALPEDLVEEIGRLEGYERIPETPAPPLRPLPAKPSYALRQELARVLLGQGFTEVYNYSFYSRDTARVWKLPEKDHLEVENPLSQEQELLRLSLLPNLCQTALMNLRHSQDFLLCEFGNVYLKPQTENFHDAPRLALCAAGRKSLPDAFAGLKGRVTALFGILKMDFVSSAEHSPRAGKRLVFLSARDQQLGFMEGLEAEGHVLALAEFDLEAMAKSQAKDLRFKPFSRQPREAVDLAIVVDEKVPWQSVEKLIGGRELVSGFKLFDVYRGPQVAKGKKSLAFEISFQHPSRTLTREEVSGIMDKIKRSLMIKLKAEIR